MRRAALIATLLLCLVVYAAIAPHVFAVPVIALLWVLYVLIWPHKPCGRCSGWGSRRRRRRSACSHCDGTGIRFRLSARLVHKVAALAVRSGREWLRRRREAG